MAREGFRLGSFGTGMGGTIYPGGMTGRGTGIIFRKSFKKGGSVGSASKRADGCAKKGKTKGKMV